MSVKNTYYNQQNLMRKQNFDLTLRQPEHLFSRIHIAQNTLLKKTQNLLDKSRIHSLIVISVEKLNRADEHKNK